MRAQFVNIVHPDVPGVGRCTTTALPTWEAKGWTVVSDVAPVRPEPEQKFELSFGEMVAVDDVKPEWTESGALEVEATGAAADEESTA